MTNYKSEFLRVLSERGFIHQLSDGSGLDDLLTTETVSGYIGFDATASSLHIGSLTQIMLLYWLQHTGHRPIVLMGGGTTMVGDPSGKDESRQLISRKEIENNKVRIKACFSNFLDFGDGTTDAVMPDNADWLLELNYVEFLRDYGSSFSVNSMLSRDSVKSRLEREQHLSFLEFNYMCLQAYDFVELQRRYDCRLQMGGSDQWGNIVSGVDLGRRLGLPSLYGLTSPLLTTASGDKMGKTSDGAVWLDGDMLAVFDFWQYWRNVDDSDVGRFLSLFTTLPLDEIERLSSLEGAELNHSKKVLATEVTRLVHGDDAAMGAEAAAHQTFDKKEMAEGLPTIEIDIEKIQGYGILALIVEAKFASSNSEARRHIQGGAVRINDESITDPEYRLDLADFGSKESLILSFGKKRHVLVKQRLVRPA